MDEIINHYIDTTYTPELAALLYRALGLLGVYQVPGPIVQLSEHLLRDQEIPPEQISDGVVEILERGLGQLFIAHRIDVSENLSLADAVQMLEAIVSVEYLEDYSGLAEAISNPQDDARTTLTKMLGYLTEREPVDFEAMIDDVYEVTIDRLKTFVENATQAEETTEDLDQLKLLRHNLLIYDRAFGKPGIAVGLAEMDFELGWTFDTYMGLVQEEVIDYNDMETTVFGLFWLSIISSDGHMSPQAFLVDQASRWYSEYTEMDAFTKMVNVASARFQTVKAEIEVASNK